MKNKKIASILVAMILVFSTFSTSLAADLDLTGPDGTTHSFTKWTFDGTLFSHVTFSPEKYLIEINDNNYKLNEVMAEMDKGKSVEEAIKNLEPVDEPSEDLEVVEVSAITEYGVTVRFEAATEDIEEANVVVKDGEGNVVETLPTLVAEGDTSAEFLFVTPFEDDDFKVGVWTVNGVEYDFDAINQLKDIKKEAEEPVNEIKFLAALNAAGIKNVDKDLLVEYAKKIVEKDEEVETLADVQSIINKVNEEKETDADKKAKAEAVHKAKNQIQLLEALSVFDRVNDEWIVEYAEKFLPEGGYKGNYDQIQADIYTVNKGQIDKANKDNNKLKAKTAAEQAKITALIEKWMKPDEEGVKDKEKAIYESQKAEALFRITDAKTANQLYRALEDFAKFVAEEENPNLKLKDLNADNKSFYWAVIEDKDDNDKTVRETLIEAIQSGSADVKTTIVDAGNEKAEGNAKVKVLEAINKIDDKTKEADVVELLEEFLNVHEEEDVKIYPEFAKAYKEGILEAMKNGDDGDTEELGKEDVDGVISQVNKDERAKAGYVATEQELNDAIDKDEVKVITFETNIKTENPVELKSNKTIDGNGYTLVVGTTGGGDSTAEGLHIPNGVKNVVIKNLTVKGTHRDNLIEIYSDATLENVKAIGGKKAGIYVNNNGTGTITVNFKNIETAGNGWNAGVGIVSQKLNSKVIANFEGIKAAEEVAVYTDDISKYHGEYEVNGLDHLRKELVTDRDEDGEAIQTQWKWFTK